jgi:signal transduction histidine kinase
VEKKLKQKFDPLMVYLNLIRFSSLSMLFIYHENLSNNPSGMLMILGLLIFLILRYQFPNNTKVLLFHSIFVAIMVIIIPEMSFAFAIVLGEAFLMKKPYIIIPALIICLFADDFNLALIIIYSLASLLGAAFGSAIFERELYKKESDYERRIRYEVERSNLDLLSDQEEIFQMTELTERNRIAAALHDDVGHELTGAVLGLQVLDVMLKPYELGKAEAEQLLKVKNRVNDSAQILRQTVHNMKPYAPIGAESLRNLAEDFEQLDIHFITYGNSNIVPVYYWVLLKTALKEGLTNIIRHSKAKSASVQVDIGLNIVRFSIINDGVLDSKDENYYRGIGIRNLRQRVKAFNGTLTTTKSIEEDTFKMIIVLPLSWRDIHE